MQSSFFFRQKKKRENVKPPVRLYEERERDRESENVNKYMYKLLEEFFAVGVLCYWDFFRGLLYDDIKISNLISSRLRYGFGFGW